MNISPLTRRRLRKFYECKPAYYSLIILLTLYGLSLAAELWVNGKPLLVIHQKKMYLPLVKFYPESEFIAGGEQTEADYKKVKLDFKIMSLIPFGPYEIDRDKQNLPDRIEITVRKRSAIFGSIRVNEHGIITEVMRRAAEIIGCPDNSSLLDKPLDEILEKDATIKIMAAIKQRYQGPAAGRLAIPVETEYGQDISVKLSTYNGYPLKSGGVKLSVSPPSRNTFISAKLVIDSSRTIVKIDQSFSELIGATAANTFDSLIQSSRIVEKQEVTDSIIQFIAGESDTRTIESIGFNAGLTSPKNPEPIEITIHKELLKFPLRPNLRHIFGLDEIGRDVFSRTVYAFRLAMNYSIILVIFTMLIGFIIGSVQGYFGGLIDMAGQRLIEIWSAIPFLYVILLMGDFFGRGFAVLLFCYGLFNWIGISYYIRAEFLRLRKFQFVEAAQALGLPWYKIIYRHVLPNSLTPIITFFPFSFMSAIGVLTALDYLGYGLPAPLPSWGEHLAQAQANKDAWWLVLFPSSALFTTMMLLVFIGDGIREAFDPKPYSKLE